MLNTRNDDSRLTGEPVDSKTLLLEFLCNIVAGNSSYSDYKGVLAHSPIHSVNLFRVLMLCETTHKDKIRLRTFAHT